IRGLPFWTPQRKVRVAFPNAQGLQQRAEVMVEGVTVGEVQSVDLVAGRPVAGLVFNKRNLPGDVRIRIASPLLGFTGPHVEPIPPGPPGARLPDYTGPLDEAPTLQGESAAGAEEVVPKADRLVDNLNRLTLQTSALTSNLNRVAANPQVQKDLVDITRNF